MKHVDFIPTSLDAEKFVPRPIPAREARPDWVNRMPVFKNNKMQIDMTGQANLTAKMCAPFMDTFNFGYIQETWCDIYVEKDSNGFPNYYYSNFPHIVFSRSSENYPQDDLFYETEFLWKIQWSPRLPSGYSVLYTHPLNRDDLPFRTLSGIIDADRHFFESNGNHPFFIKKDFEGIIPKGTPMFQIIPFKRDDWKAGAEPFDPDLDKQKNFLRSKFWGIYKTNYWSKKTFK